MEVGAGEVVSIVIPARNAAETIGAQLEALVDAEKPPCQFEVIVIDNGSTDDTAAIVDSFAERLPVRIVEAADARGTNFARNAGVRASHGRWLLFCDADDEADESWLVRMVERFEAGHELVAGPIDYRRLNPPEVRAWRGADSASVGQRVGFMPAAQSANLGVSRRLFDLVDGFDEEFTYAGDDIEFIWRLQLAGGVLHEAPDAVMHYRLRTSLREHWRQSVNYGACEPLLFTKFASHGMRRRPLRAFGRDVWWLVSRLPFSWPIGRRGAWLRRCGQQWGRLLGAVRSRTVWW